MVRFSSWAGVAAATILFGLISVWMGQDIGWDVKNYHLYNGYAFLRGRLDVDVQPAQLQSYFNPLLDAAVYITIEALPPIVVGFILGAIHGLNFVLIYRIAQSAFFGLSEKGRAGAR